MRSRVTIYHQCTSAFERRALPHLSFYRSRGSPALWQSDSTDMYIRTSSTAAFLSCKKPVAFNHEFTTYTIWLHCSACYDLRVNVLEANAILQCRRMYHMSGLK
ncbi:unnamed protein product [Ixodes persulcatus]